VLKHGRIQIGKIKREAVKNCLIVNFVGCVVAIHEQLSFDRHCCNNKPLKIAAPCALLSQKCNNAIFSISFKAKLVIDTFFR